LTAKADLFKKSHELLVKFNSLLSLLTEKIKKSLLNSDTNSVFMEGFVNFFEQSEFKEPEKMRQMISLLDEKESLLQLLAQSLEKGENIMVNIGADSGLAMPDLSIVTARYRGPNNSFGRIGLIGPLRMDYGKVVTTLANISQTLSDLFLGALKPRYSQSK
jgi:heat-inducible transcriptional repressor